MASFEKVDGFLHELGHLNQLIFLKSCSYLPAREPKFYCQERAETLNLRTGLPFSRSRQQLRTGACFKNSYLTILLAYNGVYISNKCFLSYCIVYMNQFIIIIHL